MPSMGKSSAGGAAAAAAAAGAGAMHGSAGAALEEGAWVTAADAGTAYELMKMRRDGDGRGYEQVGRRAGTTYLKCERDRGYRMRKLRRVGGECEG